MSARVLVCGGREYSDRYRVGDVLDALAKNVGIACVIHGNSGRRDESGVVVCGADLLADEWATLAGVEVIRCPVTPDEWRRIGKAAGPIRNSAMLREHAPDLCVAFPGNRGTNDMVTKARNAGVEVLEVSARPHPSGVAP